MRRIVLSLKPHEAARSLTEKCFSKAAALRGGILKPDRSFVSCGLLSSGIWHQAFVVQTQISVKFS